MKMLQDKTVAPRRKSKRKKIDSISVSSKKYQQKLKISYKSILLDFLERKKTIERIVEACPNLSKTKILQISELILFKCRKCNIKNLVFII